MHMSKERSIKIDNKLFKKLDNHGMDKKDIITKALNQFFENKEPDEEQDNEIVTTLNGNVQTLEKKNESLEIDNICLFQENKKLQTRIDDLAQMYPSAVALLGKASETRQIKKNRWVFKK